MVTRLAVASIIAIAAFGFAVATAVGGPDEVTVRTKGTVAGTLPDGRVVVETPGGVLLVDRSEIEPVATATPEATPTEEPTPEPTPEPTAEPTPEPVRWPYRAYTDTSPWNTPIAGDVKVLENSAAMVATLGPTLTSDPTQYSYPRYVADQTTPTAKVDLSGAYSDVTDDSEPFTFTGSGRFDPTIPIPPETAPVPGSDGQVIIVDPETGDEWGFWQFAKTATGYRATNGYHYNLHWDAVPPASTTGGPFGSQGAGIPYYAGVVHPEEVKAGEIRHAINLAALAPSAKFVYPAAKSDGTSTSPDAAPEGQRFQLDPSKTDGELEAAGCKGVCLTIAHALQRYGAYVTDKSGRSKLRIQAQQTAGWGTGETPALTASTVSPIPMAWFRAVAPPEH